MALHNQQDSDIDHEYGINSTSPSAVLALVVRELQQKRLEVKQRARELDASRAEK